MARMSLEEFTAGDATLAARFSSADLRGWFGGGTLEVPEGCLAFVTSPSKDVKVFSEREAVEGDFSAVLVKTADIPLSIEAQDARSSEALRVDVSGILVFRFGRKRHDLEAVRDNLVGLSGKLSRSHLQKTAEGEISALAVKFVAERSAEELYEPDVAEEFFRHARTGLKRLSFRLGLELVRLEGVSFHSEKYEELRRDHIERQMEALKAEEAAKLEKKKAEENEKVRELRRLTREKKLLHKKKLEALELEARLEKIKKYEEAGLDPDLALVEDEDELERIILYKKLPPEKIKALEEAATRKGITRGKVENLTRRVFTAQRKTVVSYDPRLARPEAPREVYDYSEKELGHVRSVRMAEVDGKPYLLAGAQRGVYVQELSGDYRLEEYKLPGECDSRGGVNSACMTGEFLFATHSDYGLVRWPFGRPGHGRKAFEEIILRNAYCRGVEMDDKDNLYFTSGPLVLRTDSSAEEEPVRFESRGEEITSITAAHPRYLYAANAGGSVIRWEKDDPAHSRAEPVKKPGTVYSLNMLRTAGRCYLVIGSKDYSLTVYDTDSEETYQFHAPERIRWAGCADDFLYATNRPGTSIFVWETDNPRRELLTIRTDKTVHDLAVWTEKAGD